MSAALSKALLVFLIAAGSVLERVSAAAQSPFQVATDVERSNFVNSPVDLTGDSEFYQFKWPIRRVAIIGAGVRSVPIHLELWDINMVSTAAVCLRIAN
jgi:hypothetical protein